MANPILPSARALLIALALSTPAAAQVLVPTDPAFGLVQKHLLDDFTNGTLAPVPAETLEDLRRRVQTEAGWTELYDAARRYNGLLLELPSLDGTKPADKDRIVADVDAVGRDLGVYAQERKDLGNFYASIRDELARQGRIGAPPPGRMTAAALVEEPVSTPRDQAKWFDGAAGRAEGSILAKPASAGRGARAAAAAELPVLLPKGFQPSKVPNPMDGPEPASSRVRPTPAGRAARAALSALPFVGGLVAPAASGRPVSIETSAAKDASGRPRKGRLLAYADGRTLFEGDGLAVETARGKAGVVEKEVDARAGAQRLKLDGRDILTVTEDPASGGARQGEFRGVRFSLHPGETARLTDDALGLVILKRDRGPELAVRWLGPAHETGFVLPDGQGAYRTYGDVGRRHWEFELAPSFANGAKVDLSILREHPLPPELVAPYTGFLRGAPQLARLSGLVQGAGGVAAVSILDGRLRLALGAGENSTRIVAATAAAGDGRLAVRAYLLRGTRVVGIWALDGAGTVCDQLEPRAQADGAQSFERTARFRLWQSRWLAVRERLPPIKDPWGMRDLGDVESIVHDPAIADVAYGLGKVSGAAFSPFQSALYWTEGGILHVARAAAGFDDPTEAAMAKLEEFYTLRQAAFSEYAGRGTQTPDEARAAYVKAMRGVGPQARAAIEPTLDQEARRERERREGPLYELHSDEPISQDERAQAAARMFGLSNLPAQEYRRGHEASQAGGSTGMLVHYGLGLAVNAAETYVEGEGFDAVANVAKLSLAGRLSGLSRSETAEVMTVRQAEQTARQLRATNIFDNVSEVEDVVMLAPSAVQAARAGSICAVDRDAAQCDAFITNVGTFAGLGLAEEAMNRASEMISARGAARRAAAAP